MPVLPAEPTTHPLDLFDAGCSARVGSREWWVLRTKPRQEKAVAREHLSRSVPFFLPTTKKTRLRRGEERSSFVPLFPGYLFGFATNDERYEINRTGRVASFVHVSDQATIWEELRNLHELIERGLDVHPVLHIKEGNRVTIRSGPLKGITGVVQRTAGKCRFVVHIDFLQTGAAVEIDEPDLELISEN